METLYCTCGEPVMDAEYDAGCRRCGRPVDFTPLGPPPAPFACTPDESAGVREELQRANELAAFAEATASLVCPDCGADTFATRDADGDLAAVCSNNECPRVFVAGTDVELRARLAREAGELQAGRDPRD